MVYLITEFESGMYANDIYYIGIEALSSLIAEDFQDVFSTPNQLAGDLITLTLLPRARWQTLLNLDVIHVCSIYILIGDECAAHPFSHTTLATQQAKGTTKGS